MQRIAPTMSNRKRKADIASTLENEQGKGKPRRTRQGSDRGHTQKEVDTEVGGVDNTREDEVIEDEVIEDEVEDAAQEAIPKRGKVTRQGRGVRRGGRGKRASRGRQHREEDVVVEDGPHDEVMAEDDDEDDSVVGPIDRSILTGFRNHVAVDIWRGRERAPLKVLGHQRTLKLWSLQGANQRLVDKVSASSLVPLAEYTYRYNSKVIISAFVERWHPETNSFHFRFGEMTITLDDVAQLIGLPIEGDVVHTTTVGRRDNLVPLIMECLGVSEDEAQAENKHGGLSLEWLHSTFSEVTDDDPEERVDCCARAYLLFLLGCTLFVDKSGNRVHVGYLALFKDLGKVRDYAWGAAALAYLYRELGQGSKSKTKQMGGYSTLLEAWILEHFPMFRHGHNVAYTEELPRVARWFSRLESPMATVKWYRELLDDVEASKVVFDPYKTRRLQVADIVFYTGLIYCMHIVEPYMPDRVLRQFSLVQLIPRSPVAPSRGTLQPAVGKSSGPYLMTENVWANWPDHLLNDEMRVNVKSGVPWESHPDYLPWFRRISHFRMAPGRAEDELIETADERLLKGLAILGDALNETVSSTSSNDLRQTIANAWNVLSGSEYVEARIPSQRETTTYTRRRRA